MSLTFERWYPWLFGAVASLLSWHLDWHLPASANLPSLLSAAISVSAILVGFTATMKSILMAVPSVIAGIKEADYLGDLATYLSAATTSNLVFCVFSLSGFFVWATTHSEIFSVMWVGLGVSAVLAFWRVTRIMTLLLRKA